MIHTTAATTVRESGTSSSHESDSLMQQHSYRDHVHESEETHWQAGRVRLPTTLRDTFPVKLHSVLSSIEREGLSNIMSWQPHGRCFVIHQPDELEAILPRFFSLSKLTSFHRQLYLYGFKRISQGIDRGGFYHECFLRGKVFLAQRIRRFKVKGTGVRTKANPQSEPNFYTMEWVGGGAGDDESKGGTKKNMSQEHEKMSTVDPHLSTPAAATATLDLELGAFSRLDQKEQEEAQQQQTTKRPRQEEEEHDHTQQLLGCCCINPPGNSILASPVCPLRRPKLLLEGRDSKNDQQQQQLARPSSSFEEALVPPLCLTADKEISMSHAANHSSSQGSLVFSVSSSGGGGGGDHDDIIDEDDLRAALEDFMVVSSSRSQFLSETEQDDPLFYDRIIDSMFADS